MEFNKSSITSKNFVLFLRSPLSFLSNEVSKRFIVPSKSSKLKPLKIDAVLDNAAVSRAPDARAPAASALA